MRVISKKKLMDALKRKKNAPAKQYLMAWYHEAKEAVWKTPPDIKEMYSHASILKDGRVVFNINGNKFRLVVKINYEKGIVLIKFFGTHKDYDKINAQEVEYGH